MADRSVKAILKADVSSFIASMKQAQQSTKDFAKNSMDSSTKNKASWDKVGTGMMITGGVMAAGIGLAVKTFADFDAAMSQAQAGTMATGSSLASLRQAAIDAGAATQFSATEAAQAITAMGKAGVSTKDILGGGLTGALDLAAAGQLDVATAAEIAATAMNQFGLAGKDIPHVADLLAAGAGKAMGSVEQLAGALKYVGPVAKGLGVSIEETTGTLAMFAQQGIIGEQAGTSMRGMLLTLTSPSGIVSKRMQELGLNMYDANGEFIGMQGAAGELQKRLGPLDDATRNAALGQIFGNEQVTAARVLYEGGAPAVADWAAKVNDAGFASRQAAMLTDNLKGDVERLGGSLSTVLINAGSGANGMLRSMTQNLQGAVDWYGKLPVPVQKSAVGLGAVAAGGLLAVGAFMTVVPKIAETKAAMEKLNVMSGRSGAALRGLGKAAAIGGTLMAVAAALSAITNATAAAVPGVEATTKALLDAGNASGSAATSVAAIDTLFKGLDDSSSPVDDLATAFKRLTDKSALDTFSDSVDGMFGAINGGTQSAAVFTNIGTALGKMVTDGKPGQASALFDSMAKKLGLTGAETTKLMKLMPAYGEALAGAANDAKGAAGGAATLTAEQQDLATATTATKDALDKEIQSLQDAGLVVLSTRSATRGFIQAQVDAEAAVKKNGQTLDVNTQKGRDNAASLDNVAAEALNLAKSVYAETGSEEKMRASLIASRAGLVATGIKFGMTKAAANAYADGILKIPAVKRTQVQLDKAAAEAKANALQAQINSIRQGKVPGINANTQAGRDKIAALQRQIDVLHGKSVTIEVATFNTVTNSLINRPPTSGPVKPGGATGGFVVGPGTGTSDSIDARLSKGEYVVKAAAVSKYGAATFDAYNAMRFSAGGQVGPTSQPSAGPVVDMGGVRADLAEQTLILRTLIPGFGTALDRQVRTIQTMQRQN
jgi:TP901 family phage tail tape measure protein